MDAFFEDWDMALLRTNQSANNSVVKCNRCWKLNNCAFFFAVKLYCLKMNMGFVQQGREKMCLAPFSDVKVLHWILDMGFDAHASGQWFGKILTKYWKPLTTNTSVTQILAKYICYKQYMCYFQYLSKDRYVQKLCRDLFSLLSLLFLNKSSEIL